MAMAKKRIPVKPLRKSSAVKKASRPAAKKIPVAKATTRKAAKIASRSGQPKHAGQMKIAAGKPAASKKTAPAARGKKPVVSQKTVTAAGARKSGVQKKTAARKPLQARTPASKKATVLPAALGKRSVIPVKKAVKKPVKRDVLQKRTAGPKEGAVAPGQITDRLRYLKGMLISKRENILREAKEEIAKYMSGDNRQLVDTAIDEGDWAVVDISEDLSLRRLDAHRQLLLDIDECLRKIQEGTYGICEDCGEEISQKRLNVIPTATLCIDCKENKEKMQAFEQVTVI